MHPRRSLRRRSRSTADARAAAAAHRIPHRRATAADEPIGNVATLTGIATVTRNNTATPLRLQDDIYLNDVVQTSANSSLGITFNDATTFNLTANAKITIDNYVYEDGGKQNAALFDIAKGTVAFVAAAVAKTGDMKITTPTATLGIRGTTGLVEVPEGAPPPTTANNVRSSSIPMPTAGSDGSRSTTAHGARLGFAHPGRERLCDPPAAPAVRALPRCRLRSRRSRPLRDQGFVRQVHAAQTVGRQIVTAAARLPPRQPDRNQSQSGATAAARATKTSGQQQPRHARTTVRVNSGAPERQRQQQPGMPQRPGTPDRQGQPQPGAPQQAGAARAARAKLRQRRSIRHRAAQGAAAHTRRTARRSAPGVGPRTGAAPGTPPGVSAAGGLRPRLPGLPKGKPPPPEKKRR